MNWCFKSQKKLFFNYFLTFFKVVYLLNLKKKLAKIKMK